MFGVILVVTTLVAILGALLCGLITWSFGRSATASAKRSFAWGVVLGPFGIVPVLRERRRHAPSARPSSPEQSW